MITATLQESLARRRLASLKNLTRWIPNALTGVRILLAPIVVLLLSRSTDGCSVLASLLFCAAGITDFLDGRLARRWSVASTLGKFSDQFADKLIIGSVIVLLIQLHRLPLFGIALLIGRSIAKTLIVLALLRPVRFSPSRTGKLSALVIYVALASMLATHPRAFGPLLVYWAGVAIALLDVPQKFIEVLTARRKYQKVDQQGE